MIHAGFKRDRNNVNRFFVVGDVHDVDMYRRNYQNITGITHLSAFIVWGICVDRAGRHVHHVGAAALMREIVGYLPHLQGLHFVAFSKRQLVRDNLTIVSRLIRTPVTAIRPASINDVEIVIHGSGLLDRQATIIRNELNRCGCYAGWGWTLGGV